MKPDRPETLVVVVGTATEIGKTWASARLLAGARRAGRRVAARKPVQSFAAGSTEPTDAEVLGGATGEPPDDVCPPHRSYAVAMAPPMAADVLGVDPPRLDDLVAELRWPAGTSLGLVETVGGVRSPIAADGDSRDLLRAVAPDLVLLVADAGLGVIDAVRSAHDALAAERLVTYLNRFDDGNELHRRNADWLRDTDGIDVVTSIADLATRV